MIQDFIKKYKIKQIYESSSIDSLNLDMKYTNLDENTIFYGVYTNKDIASILNHKGKKWILWAGNDANIKYKSRLEIINFMKTQQIENHLVKNINIEKNLLLANIMPINLNFKQIENINKAQKLNIADIQNIQLRVSAPLKHLEERLLKKYNLKEYKTKTEPALFFGLYTIRDTIELNAHKGTKYLMWGGTDALFTLPQRKFNLISIENLKDVNNIAISDDIENRLTKENVTCKKLELNLVDKDLFKPSDKVGKKIFIYNGYGKGNENLYGNKIYEEVMKKLPNYEYILSNELNLPYEKMPEIYADCFIGLRLTEYDGNANMVQEMEAMNIPVVHNLSTYGLKWNSTNDVINHINKNISSKIIKLDDIDLFGKNDSLDAEVEKDNLINAKLRYSDFDDENIKDNIDKFYNNIDDFSSKIEKFKNILFICSDYPNYGGAATNCLNLINFYKNTHNVYGIFWTWEDLSNEIYISKNDYSIVKKTELVNKLNNLQFIPDLIILKNFTQVNLKNIFNCPVYYLIAGIYTNDLDKHYSKLKTIDDHNKYVNSSVIKQIKNSDFSFCNSKLTQKLLKDYYKLDTYIFYSGFVPFYKEKIVNSDNFDDRKYNFGLIVSNFNRKIKNINEIIEFLKDKKEVILIGKESKQYEYLGFTCLDLVDDINYYYKQIKYIIQGSFYESYSNVKIESTFLGCFNINLVKNKSINVVVSSTQYPGYGGAATNAYAIIKFLRKMNFNVSGVFFHNNLNVNFDPDNIGGIFLYNYNYDVNIVKNKTLNYLKCNNIDICFAKNYLAPILCKQIFNCYTIYLVSGINHFNLFYENKSANDLLDKNFKIDKINKKELECNNESDLIVLNSKLSLKLFNKIYPKFKNKIYNSIVDTSNLLNISNNIDCADKEYDILICCSNLTRKDKNNMFLINVLKNNIFNNFTKIIIGENCDKFKDIPNSICTGLLNHDKCISYMNKSKLLLFPSLFDANSNTVREAYYNKCLPIITNNIGFSELYPDFLVCENYNLNEWTDKIIYALNNYDLLKDTKINFTFDCYELLKLF